MEKLPGSTKYIEKALYTIDSCIEHSEHVKEKLDAGYGLFVTFKKDESGVDVVTVTAIHPKSIRASTIQKKTYFC